MLGVEIWEEEFSSAGHNAAQDWMLRAGIKRRTCAQPPFNPFLCNTLHHPYPQRPPSSG